MQLLITLLILREKSRKNRMLKWSYRKWWLDRMMCRTAPWKLSTRSFASFVLRMDGKLSNSKIFNNGLNKSGRYLNERGNNIVFNNFINCVSAHRWAWFSRLSLSLDQSSREYPVALPPVSNTTNAPSPAGCVTNNLSTEFLQTGYSNNPIYPRSTEVDPPPPPNKERHLPHTKHQRC